MSLNGFANGILDPATSDEDWFKLQVSHTTDLMFRVTRANEKRGYRGSTVRRR